MMVTLHHHQMVAERLVQQPPDRTIVGDAHRHLCPTQVR